MENEGMSPITKALIMFGAVMVVGFIIVGSTKETAEEKKLQATSLQSSMLHKLAQEKCSNAIYSKANERVYTPSESSGDNSNYIRLVWRDNGSIKEAECRYETGNGISLLKINGETVNAQGLAEPTQDGASRASTASGGGHGSSANAGGH